MKLDFLDKLFAKRVSKKEIKKNILVDIGLWIRHYLVDHKPTFYSILLGIALVLIIIPFYIQGRNSKIDQANKFFEYGLGAYRRAFVEKDLSPEERANYVKDAIRNFQYVIDNFNGTPPAADALLYQGNAYYDMGDYNNALNKYKQYAEKYSGKYFADIAWINVGKCYEQLNNFQGAEQAYKKVIDDYADSAGAAEALFDLGKIYELSNNINEAFNYYNKLVSEHPYSPWARQAKLRILFIQATMVQKKKP